MFSVFQNYIERVVWHVIASLNNLSWLHEGSKKKQQLQCKTEEKCMLRYSRRFQGCVENMKGDTRMEMFLAESKLPLLSAGVKKRPFPP